MYLLVYACIVFEFSDSNTVYNICKYCLHGTNYFPEVFAANRFHIPLCRELCKTIPSSPAVSELDVLPQCEYKSLFAYPRRVKAYTGVNQVKGSYVYPKDDTWFNNWHKKDKGNSVIEKEVCDCVLIESVCGKFTLLFGSL